MSNSKSPLKVIENILIAAVFLICAYLLNNYFFTYPIIVSVLKGVALISVFAMAESIVLACGGIDLSVASIGLLSSSIMFYMVETNTAGVFSAIIFSFAAGGLAGIINGLFIAKLKLQPIIVTMATASLCYGISGAITNNIVLFDTLLQFDFIKSIPFFVIPTTLIIALFIMAGCYTVFRFTVVGRQVFAVGGSERSAKLSGLNVDRIKLLSYFGAGALAGIGGLMILADSALSARFYGGSADLEVLFAAVLGGVSLYSGSKIFFRACVGAGVVAVLNRTIYGLFVFNYMREIIIGLLVLIIIALRQSIFKHENKIGE